MLGLSFGTLALPAALLAVAPFLSAQDSVLTSLLLANRHSVLTGSTPSGIVPIEP